MTARPASGAGAGEALVSCFESCLVDTLAVIDLAAGDGSAAPDADPVREKLRAGLDSAVESAARRFDAQTVRLARRFATAWIDERLASAAWPGRDAWRSRPFQSDWGEGRTAGEWFFDALGRLSPSRDGDIALAALALRCLALDFDGKMYYTPGELGELRRAVAGRFRLAHSPAAFPPPLAMSGGGKARRGTARWWLLPLLAAGILAAAHRFANKNLDARLEARIPLPAIHE